MKTVSIAALVGTFATASATTYTSSVWCGANDGEITTQAACQAAAGSAGVAFRSNAGGEWHAGCIVHDGGAYFVQRTEGAAHSRASNQGYLCNNVKSHKQGTWCGAYDGMITTEAGCKSAATMNNVGFKSAAGNEWHAGCIVHDGGAYFVAMTQQGQHSRPSNQGYLCNNVAPTTTTTTAAPTTTTTAAPVVVKKKVATTTAAPCPQVRCANPAPCSYVPSALLNADGCPMHPCGIRTCKTTQAPTAANCPITCMAFDKDGARINGPSVKTVHHIKTQHTTSNDAGKHGPSTVHADCKKNVGGCQVSKVITHSCAHNQETGVCACTCK